MSIPRPLPLIPCALLLFGLAACGGGGSTATTTTSTTPTSSRPPELDAWVQNATGLTGYGGLPANVQKVQYSTTHAYVSASGIPAYAIGPWPGNPNLPSNQAFVVKLPRGPQPASGTRTATPLGVIGLFTNGVAIFNPKDAHSYNNQGVWNQNAVVFEADGFDAAHGHVAPGGAYHHHQNPVSLYGDVPSAHSPILGYAFDGYPVYGPRGYANPDGSGGIVRITSGYRLRALSRRTTLPDGTALAPAQYGPDVSAQYPLGGYMEDWEYAPGSGLLDAYNGRFAITPDYPQGTYAYYVTLNADGSSAFPYVLGPQYYGAVVPENLSTHGHATVSETVQTYVK